MSQRETILLSGNSATVNEIIFIIYFFQYLVYCAELRTDNHRWNLA